MELLKRQGMVNPFDYLYYKVYKALSFISGGGNPIAMGATGILIVFGFFNASYIISGGGVSMCFLKITFGVMFLPVAIYYSVRERKILAKFEFESDRSRTIGNILVIAYSTFALLGCFLILRKIL